MVETVPRSFKGCLEKVFEEIEEKEGETVYQGMMDGLRGVGDRRHRAKLAVGELVQERPQLLGGYGPEAYAERRGRQCPKTVTLGPLTALGAHLSAIVR